jgi:hypothetical protein
MADDLDVTNKFLVGAAGPNIVIMNPPRSLSVDDALVFAAWIVALAEYRAKTPFADVLEKVQDT